jgi:hypothetical protein
VDGARINSPFPWALRGNPADSALNGYHLRHPYIDSSGHVVLNWIAIGISDLASRYGWAEHEE